MDAIMTDMDVSSPPFSLCLAPAPFSPWLRLAHKWRVPASQAQAAGSLRVLRDWEFFLQLDGSSGFILPAAADCTVSLPAGACALIPPGLEHAWLHQAGAHIAVHFDLHAQPDLEPMAMISALGREVQRSQEAPDWRWHLDCGGAVMSLPLVVDLPDPAPWIARFEVLIALYRERRHRDPVARLRAAGILGRSFTDWLDLAQGAVPPDGLLAILAEAAQEEPGTLSIADLAASCGLGQTAFRSAVHRLTGRSPRRHLERLRLERAAYALRSTGDTVAAIAHRVGFPDPLHFSRVFRRVYGASPLRWRKGTTSDDQGSRS